MDEDKQAQVTSISGADTLEKIAEFWDNHSLADYWNETTEANFQVRANPRRRITIAPDLYAKIVNYAGKNGLSPETLINLWLMEKLQNEAVSQ